MLARESVSPSRSVTARPHGGASPEGDLPKRAPRGMGTFTIATGLIGVVLLANAGMSAFELLAFALSQIPGAEDQASLVTFLGLFVGLWVLGACFVAMAVGLRAGRPWALSVGVAGQIGLIAGGVAGAFTWFGYLFIACVVAFPGILYLSDPQVHLWIDRQRPSDDGIPTLPTNRLAVWLRPIVFVVVCLELGVLLVSPLGLAYISIPSGEPGTHDLGLLVLMLGWLGSMAALEFWFLRAGDSGRRRAFWLGQSIAVTIALGALLPWVGWVRAVPIVVALTLEPVLVSDTIRDRLRS